MNRDLKRLSGLGVKKAHTFAYQEGGKYFDLSHGVKELTYEEKPRKWTMSRWTEGGSHQQYLGGGLLLLLIIIIVVVVLMRRRRN